VFPASIFPGSTSSRWPESMGVSAARLEDIGKIKKAAANAWVKQKPPVLEIPISAEVPQLI
jgi:hypothetical protein